MLLLSPVINSYWQVLRRCQPAGRGGLACSLREPRQTASWGFSSRIPFPRKGLRRFPVPPEMPDVGFPWAARPGWQPGTARRQHPPSIPRGWSRWCARGLPRPRKVARWGAWHPRPELSPAVGPEPGGRPGVCAPRTLPRARPPRPARGGWVCFCLPPPRSES